jgi:hypothetical protein
MSSLSLTQEGQVVLRSLPNTLYKVRLDQLDKRRQLRECITEFKEIEQQLEAKQKEIEAVQTQLDQLEREIAQTLDPDWSKLLEKAPSLEANLTFNRSLQSSLRFSLEEKSNKVNLLKYQLQRDYCMYKEEVASFIVSELSKFLYNDLCVLLVNWMAEWDVEVEGFLIGFYNCPCLLDQILYDKYFSPHVNVVQNPHFHANTLFYRLISMSKGDCWFKPGTLMAGIRVFPYAVFGTLLKLHPLYLQAIANHFPMSMLKSLFVLNSPLSSDFDSSTTLRGFLQLYKKRLVAFQLTKKNKQNCRDAYHYLQLRIEEIDLLLERLIWSEPSSSSSSPSFSSFSSSSSSSSSSLSSSSSTKTPKQIAEETLRKQKKAQLKYDRKKNKT